MVNDIRETHLPNGLFILTKEVHAAPVATSWLWYRVGSRNERIGQTGISHWVEHMMFKGTPTRPKGSIMRAVNRNGGVLNAFTSRDYTAYFENIPSDRLDLVLEMEADRMVNALFDVSEVQSERSVILSEREGYENNPVFLLDEELNAAAFKVHPYGHATIGWKCDLQAITRDDLYRHYRTYYTPNNTTLVLVGDFETNRILDRVARLFGVIPPGPPVPPVTAVEPPQEGERRVTIRRPGGASYLSVAYHVPAVTHPDFYPLFVLAGVLSGVRGLGFMGSGVRGRSARLYRALVAKELATAADVSFGPTKDPGLFAIEVTARHGVDPARLEQAVLSEVEKIIREPISERELVTVLKQIKAQLVYASDGVANLGYVLGLFETVATYRLYLTFLDNISKVRPADVQRVAATYLTETNRTVGTFIPTGPEPEAKAGSQRSRRRIPGFMPSWPVYWQMPDTIATTQGARGVIRADDITRVVLDNGLTILVRENHTSRAVSLRGVVKAGAIYDGEAKPGVAVFTAAAVERGTVRRSFERINRELDGMGASFGISGGTETTDFSGRCLSEDLGQLLAIIADILMHPAFPLQEIGKVRGEILTGLREAKNDTRWVADRQFHSLAYPKTHPYHRPAEGTEESVVRITRRDLVAFHAAYYRPDTTIIAIVGDVTPQEALTHLTRSFGRWGARGVPPPFTVPPVRVSGKPRRKNVHVPGKSQADIIVGFPGIPRTDPDYYATMVANLIVGRIGLYGRLGANVRDRMGLAYYVYSDLDAGVGPGPWVVRAGVNPKNMDKAIEGIMAELDRLRHEPVAPDELGEAQDFLIGSLALRLETNDGVASSLVGMELFNLGLDYLERYPTIIRSLTPADVQAAAERHLLLEHATLVIAGPVK